MITKRFGFWSNWLVLLLLLLGSATSTWAQRNDTEADLPVFGIGAYQAFRFSVAAFPNRDRDAGSACVATLSFRDTRNRPFGPSHDVNLQPGEATFLELDGWSLGLSARQRMDFRPVLSLAPESGGCQTTFSILDLAGRLVSQVPGLVLIPFSQFTCPTYDSTFSQLVLDFGVGQTLRATVVRMTNPIDVDNAPLPCDVTLNLMKGGQLVASLATGFLAPGQAVKVDVPFAAMGLPFGETAMLKQEVVAYPTPVQLPGYDEPCPASSDNGCIISHQVFNRLTGSTEVIWVPLQFQRNQ